MHCPLKSNSFKGTPGGRWTDEELINTKAKLRWTMIKPYDALKSIPGGSEVHDKYLSLEHVGSHMKLDAIAPNMAKIIRLTFHDCVKETSGAGCNGCLNFEGMGNIYELDTCGKGTKRDCSEVAEPFSKGPKTGPSATDNNNLQWVARVLEGLYKDPNYGPAGLNSEVSLFESGKSRADLWAFAGLVAVQFSTETNNHYCNPTGDKPAPCFNQVNKDSPSCFIDLPTPEFRSGRSDCLPSCTGENSPDFCTSNEEFHPSPHGNGDATIDFFKEHFDFNPKEAAALMGVHTVGHPQEFNSMFRHYSWTGRIQRTMFNNLYYRFVVEAAGSPTHYRLLNPMKIVAMDKPKECGLKVSAYVGDEFGNPFTVKYRIRNEKRTEAGGPWDWSMFGVGCSRVICAGIDTADYHINSCCRWLDACISPPKDLRPKFKCPSSVLQYVCEGEEGCTDRNIFQKISMINPDMGLFLNFTTNADGRPTGCKGMDYKPWLNNWQKHSEEIECELNQTPTPGGQTLAGVMQHYADDQTSWIKDFVAVFDKMLENGVEKENLSNVPTAWFSAEFDDRKKWSFL